MLGPVACTPAPFLRATHQLALKVSLLPAAAGEGHHFSWAQPFLCVLSRLWELELEQGKGCSWL